LGQEIIPVNKPSSTVAGSELAVTKPDGYTIMINSSGMLTNLPYLQKPSYDPLVDIVPVVQVGILTNIFAVRSDFPANSFKEFVEYARKNPQKKISCGIATAGFGTDLGMRIVSMQEKVDIAVVPTGSSAALVTALLGGHVAAIGGSVPGLMPQVKAGKVKILASTADKRMDFEPNVPTLFELGYKQGILNEVYMISALRELHQPVIKKLEGAVLQSDSGT